MERKKTLIMLLLPLFVFSCNKNRVTITSSPFNDGYIIIGINSEYNFDLTSITADEKNAIAETIVVSDNPNEKSKQNDNLVTSFTRCEETRDLKYAYFGQEDASAKLCSMLSSKVVQVRHPSGTKGAVTKTELTSDLQNQVANGGIIKNHSTINDYVYDSHYRNPSTYSMNSCYGVRESVSYNYGEPSYSSIVEENTDIALAGEAFVLKPYTEQILSHFTTVEDFGIFQKDAVSGKAFVDNQSYYLIMEAYSIYNSYSTTIGRSYKAVDNYFYEALLQNFETTNAEKLDLRFVTFRFYHEKLILSEAYYSNVPIIYLDKPILVEYSEIKYNISYNEVLPYNQEIK